MKRIYFILCCFFTTFAIAQNESNLNQGDIRQTKYLQTIGYEKAKGKIFVTVSINGEKYKFLFDTGAPFAISKKIYDQLHLPKTGSLPIQDASGKSEEMIITMLPDLQLGEISFLNTPGIVFQESSSPVFGCLDVDGIIGSNMLRNSVIQFDELNHQLTITDNAKNLSLKKVPYQELELSQTQSNPFIKITLQKGNQAVSDNLLFDTGADGFYEMSVAAYLYFKQKSDVAEVIAENDGSSAWGLHGMEGKEHQYELKVPGLILCHKTFNNVIVTTTGSNESRIGSKLLNYGKVTVDYKKKRFYFEPYTNANTDELSEHLWAIAPTLQDNKMVVGIIWDKTLENTINLGDEILNFNGIDYQSMDFCKLVRAENKFTNNQATVTLKDLKTGEIKTIEIKRL